MYGTVNRETNRRMRDDFFFILLLYGQFSPKGQIDGRGSILLLLLLRSMILASIFELYPFETRFPVQRGGSMISLAV